MSRNNLKNVIQHGIMNSLIPATKNWFPEEPKKFLIKTNLSPLLIGENRKEIHFGNIGSGYRMKKRKFKYNFRRYTMLYKRSSLQDYFYNSDVALTNAVEDKKIYQLISAYNMTDVRIGEGHAMLTQLINLDKIKTEAHGKQLEARAALYKLWDEVHPGYMEHVNFTKLKCMKSPDRLGRMMLLGPRQTVLNGWMRQAETFYSNLLLDTEMVTQLEVNAITVDKLTAAQAKVKEVQRANTVYQDTKGIAQDALEVRDALLAQFELWLKEFIYVCKVALRDNKQLLESLKIQVLSKGYVRRKNEPPQAVKTTEADAKTLAKKAAKGKKIRANVEEVAAMENLLPGSGESLSEIQSVAVK